MRINESLLRQLIRETILREGMGIATPAEVEAGIRGYVSKNISPSAGVRDTLREMLGNPELHAGTPLRSLVKGPEDDGLDPFAYRGITISPDQLPAFGLDPELIADLPTGGWIDLDHPKWDIEAPTVAINPWGDWTVTSWSYDPQVAKKFAEAGSDGISIVLKAKMYRKPNPNARKFLDLFPLYTALRFERQAQERELMGVASDADPILGSVKLIKMA